MPSWIVFEAVITKLPHYVLPLYPAIAFLTAGAVESTRDRYDLVVIVLVVLMEPSARWLS